VRKSRRLLVNDIDYCLAQARKLTLSKNLNPICEVFKSLAQDETAGLIAYSIWRTRGKVISFFNCPPGYLQSGESISRVSQAHSCWHEESAAFDDLPSQRRPGR
jgi:hypothetical protein